MAKLYCPYCPPCYQIHKERSDGVLVCGQCGDPLVKKHALKFTQLFAIIAVVAFITPLLFTIFASIQDLNRPKLRKNIPELASIFLQINSRDLS